jgi:predicted DNA-binding transcriptional regulator
MKELREKLQELGLAGREAEVYLALLGKRELTAPEISRITTITRTKAYEILQNLVKKGLCNETYKNASKVFTSVEPKIAIHNLLSVYEQELIRKKELAEKSLEKLVALYNDKDENTDSLDYIEVLTNVGQIRERWLEIEHNTKKEIIVFTKPPYTAKFGTNIEAQSKMKNNNVKMRGLYEYASLQSPEEIKNLIRGIEAFQSVGEESKIIKELPIKLAVIDEKITMLVLNDPVSMQPSITTIVVTHTDFARAQKAVFETYWDKAMIVQDFKEKFEEEHLLIGNKT